MMVSMCGGWRVDNIFFVVLITVVMFAMMIMARRRTATSRSTASVMVFTSFLP